MQGNVPCIVFQCVVLEAEHQAKLIKSLHLISRGLRILQKDLYVGVHSSLVAQWPNELILLLGLVLSEFRWSLFGRYLVKHFLRLSQPVVVDDHFGREQLIMLVIDVDDVLLETLQDPILERNVYRSHRLV